MSEQIKCPVCEKEDIPDYHKEDVICPCCGTDLSIYRMLADSQEHFTSPQANNRIWKIATAASAAIAIASIVLLCIPRYHGGNTNLSKDIVVLKDSISKVLSELDVAKEEITNLKGQLPPKASDNIYIVKKNDSPCKISRKLFGTERRYKEIEAIITKPLSPGDTLYIKK